MFLHCIYLCFKYIIFTHIVLLYSQNVPSSCAWLERRHLSLNQISCQPQPTRPALRALSIKCQSTLIIAFFKLLISPLVGERRPYSFQNSHRKTSASRMPNRFARFGRMM